MSPHYKCEKKSFDKINPDLLLLELYNSTWLMHKTVDNAVKK